jgi:hypothetical protein
MSGASRRRRPGPIRRASADGSSHPGSPVSYPAEDSPSGLGRTLGKRVGCKPSGVRIPYPLPALTSANARASPYTGWLSRCLVLFPGHAANVFSLLTSRYSATSGVHRATADAGTPTTQRPDHPGESGTDAAPRMSGSGFHWYAVWRFTLDVLFCTRGETSLMHSDIRDRVSVMRVEVTSALPSRNHADCGRPPGFPLS